ncbi:helix-turn-helix transcriptional regulator [Clostridium felsineum]|uniref:helix-turn-helix transcriptional regulator n=1 Tax=Clostridium felsineum TaxID=36839 RepID=UPI00214D2BCB|nr:helix-turn-helix transcriptional regulator [Clostridium felsineum]MCR3760295.1 helix-turn-helix transcriptional regulator [Clostridium felsineum]
METKINNKLKYYREKMKLTQENVADTLSIAVSTYNQFERNRRKVSLIKAKELSIVFNTTIEELFFTK